MTNSNRPFSQADLAALLAGLNDDFVFLETAKISPDNQKSLLFTRPSHYLQCRAGDDPLAFLERCQHSLAQGSYLAGWFAYEFGHGLEASLVPLLPDADSLVAELGVFAPPAIYHHQSGRWQGPAPTLAAAGPEDCQLSNIRLSQDQQTYEANIGRIKSYISAGDTYQVNYTLKLFFDFAGSTDALYQQLRRNQLVSYGAYLRHGSSSILSFSPELFFRKEGSQCTVRPMKGTSRRGRTPDEDRQRAERLHNDEKNRAENVMIVDLLRNDLGRLAAMGSVKVESLFDVETYESLLQMTSTISGATPQSLPLTDLFKALFPCGSITGAPKIRTMEIIHELETAQRGVYTGAIGYLSPDGDAQFNVPIRTVVINGSQGEMGIGSGIVADSRPDKEWQECRLKAHFLSKARADFQLIETILWSPATGYWLRARHINRLLASAAYFGYPLERQELLERLEEYEKDLANEPCRLRLLLDRDGELHLSHSVCPFPDCQGLPGEPLPAPAGQTRLASEPSDSSSPFVYHKTTERPLYNEQWRKAQEEGLLDVIFTNERGEVSEGAITNIFVEMDGIFYTPPVACGLLPGTFRDYLLTSFSDRVKEKVLYPADLSAPGTRLYLANSVRGLVPVTLISPA